MGLALLIHFYCGLFVVGFGLVGWFVFVGFGFFSSECLFHHVIMEGSINNVIEATLLDLKHLIP